MHRKGRKTKDKRCVEHVGIVVTWGESVKGLNVMALEKKAM